MEQQSMLDTIDADISLVLDNLPVGIIRLDSVKRCVYANKFILDALDINSCKDVRSPFIQNIHADDLDAEKQACHKFLHEHIESETTFRLYNKCQNEYRWMKNKRLLLKNTKGNNTEVSYMYTLQDVHVNQTMEIQLREESKRAEQAYNHKSIFLANMSHEIRTPLNGIIGMLTLLEDTSLSSEQQDYINMVKECSFNLMTIINDILDYSKLEVGKIVLDTRPMCLQDCIESTNDIILSKVYEKTLEYTFNISTDVPKGIIADSNRIKQILLNLLSNAIKFTDRGTIFLNVESIKPDDFALLYNLHGSKPDSETKLNPDFTAIRFDITDTGCGITDVDKCKLFKSFSQIDNHITSKVYQGTGLGLAISKELVELMGGCIWLDWSEPHKGSRFSFIIQAEIPVSTEMPVHNQEGNTVLRNANVLIVDDNLYNRLSLTGIVTKWGMKPHAFSNSEEALYFTRITQFDIGLIDICMPKCDGHTFATKLREQTEFNNKTMPLIALSSLGDKKPASKLFLAHLIKPIKEAKLKQLCVDSLRNNVRNVTTDLELPTKQSLQCYIDNNELVTLRDNIRILLAEDVYINQRVVVSFLNKLGFNNIQVVENGQQCLDYVFANKYDIILLDIRMPLLNGEVVLKRIQEHFSNIPEQNIPYIVAVTAYCLREDKMKYLNMGFDDYIPKPVSLKDLNRCMNHFIEGLLHD